MHIIDLNTPDGETIGTYLLSAVPQVGHEIVLMEMDIRHPRLKDKPLHWTVIRVVWGLSKHQGLLREGECEIRSIEVQVVPFFEETATAPQESS